MALQHVGWRASQAAPGSGLASLDSPPALQACVCSISAICSASSGKSSSCSSMTDCWWETSLGSCSQPGGWGQDLPLCQSHSQASALVPRLALRSSA